ncbi:hypothetical protein K458DRAFT_362089 [Lentithecium fluviatile CBS 122367]|uniref:BTB domain-containing protein n=1 Tax=Lentithecium fluviatile CBS 122367 TaxID=1168545 RepID=A0A6G1JB59_9PLEO|nr:hypothetical protein K458DRAFT_362089 [Lentithecium fluviatile CBS 122367]
MAVVPFHNKVESPPSPCFEISARKTRESINLLAGPAIEVVVGNDSTPPSGKRRVWWLPKNLLSHRSSFFREACDITMGEPGQPRIELASDDPIIFAFFVEWLYYEGYTAVHPVWDESIEHAAAWVLGAKLKTPEFQDHAMGHLYRIHNDVHRPQPLTSREVDYACANSPPGSYLRWLYFDLMSEHFSRRERVQGPTAEWEEVLKKHSEAMTALLGRLRDGSQQKFVRGPEAYMVKKDVQSEALLENDDVQSNADMENVDAQSDTCMENAYVRSDVSML